MDGELSAPGDSLESIEKMCQYQQFAREKFGFDQEKVDFFLSEAQEFIEYAQNNFLLRLSADEIIHSQGACYLFRRFHDIDQMLFEGLFTLQDLNMSREKWESYCRKVNLYSLYRHHAVPQIFSGNAGFRFEYRIDPKKTSGRQYFVVFTKIPTLSAEGNPIFFLIGLLSDGNGNARVIQSVTLGFDGPYSLADIVTFADPLINDPEFPIMIAETAAILREHGLVGGHPAN